MVNAVLFPSHNHSKIMQHGLRMAVCRRAACSSTGPAGLVSEMYRSTSSVIPLDHVKATISEEKIKIRPGDVLFIRSGFAGFLKTLSVEEQLNISQIYPPEFIGLESSRDNLRWI